MTFSLNEVAAVAKKAARGAGYSWGLAEEAGTATKWLSSHGFDGCGALAALLRCVDSVGLVALRPILRGNSWSAEAGKMCSLSAGTTLADSAAFHSGEDVTMKNVVAPLMLAPFASDVARRIAHSVSLNWSDSRLITNGFSVSGVAGTHSTADVTVSFDARLGDPLELQTRASPSSRDWKILNAFAERTYAPATDASRLKGAGADASDND